MLAPWRSQKSVRKHKDPITGNSFIGTNKVYSKSFNGNSWYHSFIERLSYFYHQHPVYTKLGQFQKANRLAVVLRAKVQNNHISPMTARSSSDLQVAANQPYYVFVNVRTRLRRWSNFFQRMVLSILDLGGLQSWCNEFSCQSKRHNCWLPYPKEAMPKVMP